MGKSGTDGKLSVTDFATLIGVSASAVSRAIQAGRFEKSLERQENGRFLIDVELGRIEWNENKLRLARAGADDDEDEEDETGLGKMADIEKRKSHFQAEISRLKFEEMSGLLVNAEKVKSEAFRTARLVRDTLLAIPDRVAAELASEKDPFRVRMRLDEEIRIALQNLTAAVNDVDPEADEDPSEEPAPEPEANV